MICNICKENKEILICCDTCTFCSCESCHYWEDINKRCPYCQQQRHFTSYNNIIVNQNESGRSNTLYYGPVDSEEEEVKKNNGKIKRKRSGEKN